jgi:hypothetical protein
MKAKLNNSKINQLTQKAARTGKPAEGHDTQISGLGIVVYPSGAGAWRIDYEDPRTGKRARKKFAVYPALTLAQARQTASQLFQRVALGLDPFAPTEGDELTVRGAWDRYLKEHMANCSVRYRGEAKGYGRREILPNFGHIPLSNVSRSELLGYIDKRRAETRAAGDTLYRYCHAFLEWCVDLDLLDTNPIAKRRSAGRRNRGTSRGKTNVRTRTLVSSKHGDEELGRWIAAAELARALGGDLPVSLRPSPIYCDGTITLLATGKRLEEVFEAPMAEFDLRNGIWVIPPERRKGIRVDTPPEKILPEVLPLFTIAREVVSRRARTHADEFVFSTSGARPYSTFDRNKKRLLALAGIEDVVHHDLRRSITTKLASLKFGAEVRHAVLGHVGALGRDELDGVYNLHTYAEEKAEALEQWDDYLQSLRREWMPKLAAELTKKGIDASEFVLAETGTTLIH